MPPFDARAGHHAVGLAAEIVTNGNGQIVDYRESLEAAAWRKAERAGGDRDCAVPAAPYRRPETAEEKRSGRRLEAVRPRKGADAAPPGEVVLIVEALKQQNGVGHVASARGFAKMQERIEEKERT
jgi:hypothetical protein